jgi:CheY-like chemotaxis protein/anti-sigma regulatory factor (Ser/Thr protein kinase)
VPSVRSTKVLVVDDSAMDRRLARRLIEKYTGMIPTLAVDGRDALAAIDRDVPDIVVTDLHMPEMDGLELVESVRRRLPHLPVILMTAHGSEDTAVQALRRGAASYVPKRSLADDLVSTIESVLEVSRTDRDQQRVLDCLTRSESQFVLGNDVTALSAFIGYLETILVRMKLTDETSLIQIGVALREALVNAIYHGNLEVPSSLKEGDSAAFGELAAQRRTLAPFRDRKVFVVATHTREEIRYVIRDEGPGFDPTELPDPTDLSQLDKPHGRGLLLIRTFMDEIRHNPRGNEITLIKRVTSLPD